MMFMRYESFREYIRLYPIVSVLIMINIAVYAAMLIVGSPYDVETLVRFGAQYSLPPFDTEYWRWITSMFIHGNFEHILFNCFALFVFTPPMERMLGKIRFILLYFLSGIAASLLSQMMYPKWPPVISVGASGAIYGVFGAFACLFLLRKPLFDRGSRTTLTVMLVMGFLYSLLIPQVNLYAHLGGFIAGFLILWGLLQFNRIARR